MGFEGYRRDVLEAALRSANQGEDNTISFHHFPITSLMPVDSLEALAGLVENLAGMVASGKVGLLLRKKVLAT